MQLLLLSYDALAFTYDAVGDRARISDSDGGVVTSTFNSVNLLSSRQFSGSGATLWADFAYTNRNQLGTLTRRDDLAGTTLIGETPYSYDDNMRLTLIDNQDSGGTTLTSFAYGFDASGRIATLTVNGVSTTSASIPSAR